MKKSKNVKEQPINKMEKCQSQVGDKETWFVSKFVIQSTGCTTTKWGALQYPWEIICSWDIGSKTYYWRVSLNRKEKADAAA